MSEPHRDPVRQAYYTAGLREGERRAQQKAVQAAWPLVTRYLKERQIAHSVSQFGWGAAAIGIVVLIFALIAFVSAGFSLENSAAGVALAGLGLGAIAFGIVFQRKEDREAQKRIAAHEDKWRPIISVSPQEGVVRVTPEAARTGQPANANTDDGINQGDGKTGSPSK